MSTMQKKLAGLLARKWWALLLRGLAAIAFGVLAWTRPEMSLATLIAFFGVYVLADGVLGAWTAISGRNENEHWWALLIGALVSIAVGIIAFTAPGITTLALMFYIAIWAIGTGVLQIVAAIHLRKEIAGEWLLVLGGVASVVLGVLLMANPGAGALAMVGLIAAYAVMFGIILTLLAFELRSLGASVAAAVTR